MGYSKTFFIPEAKGLEHSNRNVEKNPWFSLNHNLTSRQSRYELCGSFQNLYLSFAIVEINTWCYRKPKQYRYSTMQSLKSYKQIFVSGSLIKYRLLCIICELLPQNHSKL